MLQLLDRWFRRGWRWIVGVVAAALTALAVGVVTGSVDSLWEHAHREPLMKISVERDPAVFDAASFVDWQPYGYMTLERDEIPAPPESCRERFRWAQQLRAWDADYSVIRVYLRGVQDEPVVIDRAVLHIERRITKPSGTRLVCSAGGASPNPIALYVDLDRQQLRYGYADEPQRPLLLTLKAGEVEPLEIRAYVRRHDVWWWVELSTLWKDHREVFRIDDDGRPFHTSGVAERSVVWRDGGWTNVRY